MSCRRAITILSAVWRKVPETSFQFPFWKFSSRCPSVWHYLSNKYHSTQKRERKNIHWRNKLVIISDIFLPASLRKRSTYFLVIQTKNIVIYLNLNNLYNHDLPRYANKLIRSFEFQVDSLKFEQYFWQTLEAYIAFLAL